MMWPPVGAFMWTQPAQSRLQDHLASEYPGLRPRVSESPCPPCVCYKTLRRGKKKGGSSREGGALAICMIVLVSISILEYFLQ